MQVPNHILCGSEENKFGPWNMYNNRSALVVNDLNEYENVNEKTTCKLIYSVLSLWGGERKREGGRRREVFFSCWTFH